MAPNFSPKTIQNGAKTVQNNPKTVQNGPKRSKMIEHDLWSTMIKLCDNDNVDQKKDF